MRFAALTLAFAVIAIAALVWRLRHDREAWHRGWLAGFRAGLDVLASRQGAETQRDCYCDGLARLA